MRNCTKVFSIVVFVSWLLMPCLAWSNDVNQFYQRFVEHLKGSKYAQLEQLVRDNRMVAQVSLGIIQQKIRNEQDAQRRDALSMIARELDELIAVAYGGKDCKLSDRIADRGQGASIPEDGIGIFQRALKLCPENLNALLGIPELHKRQGQFEEATAGYKKALALKPDNPDALLGVGEVLYSAGLYQRSVPYLEEILKADPDNKKAKKLLESSTKQIALDRDGIIPAAEIADRLWSPLEGNLMCMCPSHAKLIARIRFRSITFAADSTSLNKPARDQLAELAQALNAEALKGGRYLIEGYADPIGPQEYNMDLSIKRAKAAKRYLVDVLKVNPNLLATAGVGSSRSWTTNETPAGRRANRRIEVISLGAAEKKVSGMAPEAASQQR